MTLRSIFLTALIIGICWYWLKSRELKDLALRAAAQRCASLGLELLDQSVVLRGLKPVRTRSGSLTLYRRYLFDFSSTGEQRYQGEVVLLGNRVDKITLAPHRVD
jgi:hypothetical protein